MILERDHMVYFCSRQLVDKLADTEIELETAKLSQKTLDTERHANIDARNAAGLFIYSLHMQIKIGFMSYRRWSCSQEEIYIKTGVM